MLELPKLSQARLVAASVCAHLDRNESDSPDDDSYLWALVDEERGIIAKRTIEVFDEHWHFHFDIEYELDEPSGSKSSLESLLTLPANVKEREGLITYWGSYYVDTLQLKPDNFVRVLSGLAIQRSNKSLEFDACSLNVFGDSPIRHLKWTKVAESDVNISIAAVETTSLSDDSLMKAVAITSKALKELVPIKKKRSRVKLLKKTKKKKKKPNG